MVRTVEGLLPYIWKEASFWLERMMSTRAKTNKNQSEEMGKTQEQIHALCEHVCVLYVTFISPHFRNDVRGYFT